MSANTATDPIPVRALNQVSGRGYPAFNPHASGPLSLASQMIGSAFDSLPS